MVGLAVHPRVMSHGGPVDGVACTGGGIAGIAGVAATVRTVRIVARSEREQCRIVEQLQIDGGGLGARHRLLGGFQAESRVAFQPRAHRGEPVEIAFDGERAQRRRERQGRIPGEEVGTGVAGCEQVQWFGAVHGLQAGCLVERASLVHEFGEMVFESGDAHAVGAHGEHVAHGSADRAHRRLAVETTEDVAGSESDERAAHLRQHIGGEESDGDGVAEFEAFAHVATQRVPHLFERVESGLAVAPP